MTSPLVTPPPQLIPFDLNSNGIFMCWVTNQLAAGHIDEKLAGTLIKCASEHRLSCGDKFKRSEMDDLAAMVKEAKDAARTRKRGAAAKRQGVLDADSSDEEDS